MWRETVVAAQALAATLSKGVTRPAKSSGTMASTVAVRQPRRWPDGMITRSARNFVSAVHGNSTPKIDPGPGFRSRCQVRKVVVGAMGIEHHVGVS